MVSGLISILLILFKLITRDEVVSFGGIGQHFGGGKITLLLDVAGILGMFIVATIESSPIDDWETPPVVLTVSFFCIKLIRKLSGAASILL